MGYEVMYIYYDDNANVFRDEFGIEEYDISDIMPSDEIARYKKVGGTYYSKTSTPGEMFEIEFPIREPSRSLYYDVDENVMLDEYGDVMFNIFSLVHPNDLLLFKKGKKDRFVNGLLDSPVLLVYPSNCI